MAIVYFKLLAIFAVVAIGWGVGKLRWVGEDDPARTLSNAAFFIFMPALLFRSSARLDAAGMPWTTLAAFFIPVVGMLLFVYGWQRRRNRGGRRPAAAPSVRAVSATFGNTLQVGLPVVAALWGEAGLAVHVAIISLHALTLLLVLTALVELDIARERRLRGHATTSLIATLATTARNTVIHPVVLPVLTGLAWNATGWPLPGPVDEVLLMLGQAVVPLCLVLLGMSLAYRGFEAGRGAAILTVVKLVALPALVLVVGHWGMGVSGVPLAVIVMAAALPIGSNALLFSQRYETLEAETTAAMMLSTLGYMATAPLWIAVIAQIG